MPGRSLTRVVLVRMLFTAVLCAAPVTAQLQTVTNPLGLHYSTYLSGSSLDEAQLVETDAAGNAYVTVSTLSRDFGQPSSRPVEERLPAWRTVLLKLDTAGRVVYSTNFDDTLVDGIAVDRDGVVYLASTSPDPPTSPPADIYLWRVDATGNAILIHRIGGSDQDWARGLVIDTAGRLVLVGQTRSLDFPVSESGSTCRARLEPAPLGLSLRPETFVARLSGGRLLEVRCLPGMSLLQRAGSLRIGPSVAADLRGDVYVLGTTESPSAPVTPGAFQRTFGGGNCTLRFGGPRFCEDMYLVKLASADLQTVYASYFGGDGSDVGWRITVDDQGRAYIAGSARSTALATRGALHEQCVLFPAGAFLAGCADSVLARINAAGTAIEFATYLGGADIGGIEAVGESLYMVGTTGAGDVFPRLPARVAVRRGSTPPAPSDDAFVARWNTSGAVTDAGILGGSGNDAAFGLSVTGRGEVWVAGYSRSVDFPLLRPWRAVPSTDGDAIVAKVAPLGRQRWPVGAVD